MIRRAALLVSTLALLGACTPITSYQGFQAVEANPKDVKVGVDTKSTVLEHLGSPSVVAAFDPNQWYYISQVSDSVAFRDASIKRRDIVSISFNKDDEKVVAVNSYSLKDGHVIAMNRRTTPTRGRELSFIEQLLGTIGNGGNVLPQQDINPGTQRPH
jgi:outer membrane protein assembly factor BamE (lipoprotein component of BamABCDE complex)